MAAVKTVKLPSPGPNEGAAPAETWTEQERPQPDYAAPSNTRDPRNNSEDVLDDLEITAWDLKCSSRGPPVRAVCFHRARRGHALERAAKRSSRPGEHRDRSGLRAPPGHAGNKC
jgi:hypothetical protein